MIKYEDIHASAVVNNMLTEIQYSLLKDAKSISDVKKIVDNYPNLDWNNVNKQLRNIDLAIARSKEKGYEPEIYFTNGYKDSSLGSMDLLNKGNVLLLNSFTLSYTTAYKEISDYTISKIKECIKYTNKRGDNYLKTLLHSVGNNGMERLVYAINMYESQIERQASIIDGRDINLFTYMLPERRSKVLINLDKIIDFYDEYKGIRLIWGSLSDSQKKLYKSSINGNTKRMVLIRTKLIDYFASYLTLPELEDIEKGDIKVLKRFIYSKNQ